MILKNAEKILIDVDLFSIIDLSRYKKKTLINVDLVSATIIVGANSSGEYKNDLNRH